MQATAVRDRAQPNTSEPRLLVVLSGLSYALDLAEGHPPGHTLRSTAIGLRLADELGWAAEARRSLALVLLLKDAGSSGDAAHMADALAVDDRSAKRVLRLAARAGRQPGGLVRANRFGSLAEWLRSLRRPVFGRGLFRELAVLRTRSAIAVLAPLALDAETVEAIGAVGERWDGRGVPEGSRGESIPAAARVAHVAQALESALTAWGPETALDRLRAQSGSHFDPTLVACCEQWRSDEEWWHELLHDAKPMVTDAFELDTGGSDADTLDRVAESFAAIVDAKSPYTATHSSRVAAIATGIATVLGYDEASLRTLRRAGLVHDVGKLGVSNRILDKAAPLTADERDRIQQHPRLSWSILRRTEGFSDLAWSASLHHERLDGSGYPWKLSALELDMDARILAVADAYEAITAARAYRNGLSAEQALRIIGKDSPHRYDGAAFTALERWVTS